MFTLVIDLEDHSSFASNEDPLQGFILIFVCRFEAILKVKGGENSVPGVMVENNS